MVQNTKGSYLNTKSLFYLLLITTKLYLILYYYVLCTVQFRKISQL